MKNLSIFEPQIEKHYAYKKNMYREIIGTAKFAKINSREMSEKKFAKINSSENFFP